MDENIIWQVDLSGEIYEADTDTIKQWILDGYVFPDTKVKKGALAWIDAQRVPALREMFTTPWQQPAQPVSHPDPFPAPQSPSSWTPPQDSWSAPQQNSWSQPQSAQSAWVDPAASAAGTPYGTVYQDPVAHGEAGTQCVNHAGSPARYLCSGCGASLCRQCVKLYGNAGLCKLCNQPCTNLEEARTKVRQQKIRTEGFGMQDFVQALGYPFKDVVSVILAGIFFGILQFGGRFGQLIAFGILIGYISHAIRRIAHGHIDDGPKPDLSDPAELFWTAIRMGIAITLVTFGPLVAAIVWGISSLFEEGFSFERLGASMILAGLAALWALFYYPMALLIAGYTDDFFSVINPLVGLDTIRRMGLTYVKAYFMCVAIWIMQTIVTVALATAENMFMLMNPLIGAAAYIVHNVVGSAVYFIASMMMAAVLGLAIFKSADELEIIL